MRYDVYGRFRIEVRREGDRWVAYRLGEGVRRLDPDVQLPPETSAEEVRRALEDVFHEFASPGRTIEEIVTGREFARAQESSIGRLHGRVRTDESGQMSAPGSSPPFSDLSTPAVLVEQEVVEANLTRAAERAKALGVALRPHIKTHRCVELAQRQAALGASGITCAKPGEAEVFAKAGFGDIRLAYPVIGEDKHARLIGLSERSQVSFCVDTLEGARQVDATWKAARRRARVLIKIDCGYGRAGIRWDDDDLGSFAAELEGLEGLDVIGVLTHAGQAYGGAEAGEDPKSVLRRHAGHEVERTERAGAVVRAALRREGAFEVSIGSTPTFWFLEPSGLRPGEVGGTPGGAEISAVSEVRPGNYVFHDLTQVALGAADLADCALSVLATVVSRRERDGALHLLIDAGKKTLTSDQRVGQTGFGRVYASTVQGEGALELVPDVEIVALSEEHGWLRAPKDAPWRVGDRLRIAPNHSCVVASTQERMFLVDGAEVRRELRVDARGRSS